MNELKVIFTLIGGLAIFLFGMNMMSESLQKVAGERMKAILTMLTKNPILGVLAGAISTSVLQSSSATTVMAIGFVSAGLMRLPQAISIILGANIGTTMTAQLMAFKLSNYIYLIIFMGFIYYFVSKSEKSKHIGLTILSFGLLFLGIETMGHVMKPFATSPIFTEWISRVSDIPVLGVAVGTIMTMIVQSSSATIAVLQNFASQPAADGVSSALGLKGAIPILLGDNIGTTVTALLASIGQSRDAKRTAVAHCVFNLSGCIIFLSIIPWFSQFVAWISPKGPEFEIISRQIANAHTTFNVAMTILWIPLIFLMVKIVMFIIPDGKQKKVNTHEVMYLDDKILNQPMAAMVLVIRETVHTSEIVRNMLSMLQNVVQTQNEELSKKIITSSTEVRNLYNRISDYLSNIFARGSLTEEQAEQTAMFLGVLSEIDRIGALCATIASSTSTAIDDKGNKNELSEEARSDLERCISIIKHMYAETMLALTTSNQVHAQEILKQRESIVDLDFQMRKAHVQRVGTGECNLLMTKTFNNLLHSLNRMENSCVNMAEMSASSVDFQYFLSIEQAKEVANSL